MIFPLSKQAATYCGSTKPLATTCMKSKFAGLNFDSVDILTQEEKKKVKGGYGNQPLKNLWACSADGMTWPGQPGGYFACKERCDTVFRYMFCMCTYV